MRLASRIGVTAAAAAALVAPAISTTAHAAPSSRATVTGSVPAWAKSAAFKGAAAGGAHVAFRIYLGWRNGGDAEALARAVSTPGSKSYHHFLTPAQFRQRFAPTRAQVTRVQRWLRNSGFTVD